MTAPRIVSVQTGRVARLGSRRTAFVKSPVQGSVQVTEAGLAGDEQADRRHHNDAAKAVYAYPMEAYPEWIARHPAHAELWRPGGLAENLTTSGQSEDEVCIGDILAAGTVLLQVTQPREPCNTFAARFGDATLPKAMIASGRTGWYLRVLRAGLLCAGDAVELAERPNPGRTVTAFNRLIHGKRRTRAELALWSALPGLAETWPARLARMKPCD